MQRINAMIPAKNVVDCLLWKGDKLGLFTVKALTVLVEDHQLTQTVWRVPGAVVKWLPAKVALFVWQAESNRVATKANLVSHGIQLDEGPGCVMCTAELETIDHLFLHCPAVWCLWARVVQRERVLWVMPGKLSCLIQSWEEVCVMTDKQVWTLIPFDIIWSCWLERNTVVFNHKSFNLENVWDIMLARVYWWVKGHREDFSYSLGQFVAGFEFVRLQTQATSRVAVDWQAPPSGVLKFNVDGASKGNPGESGIGGVLRDSSGQILGYFSMSTGFMWAYEAEVHAILHALLFCHHFNCHNVLIESDSTLAIG